MGASSQLWGRYGDNEIELLNSSGNYTYLDVPGGNSEDGTPLWNWVHNDSPAQKWFFRNVSIVGMGGLG